jgi:plastocyanin
MKKYIYLIILIVFSGLFLLFWSILNNVPGTSHVNNQQIQMPSAPTLETVSIKNFAFNPASLSVAVGSTVTWINNDSPVHSIKSNIFNSPDLDTGQTFSFTFNQTGTFNYSCGIHPSMKGVIIVK